MRFALSGFSSDGHSHNAQPSRRRYRANSRSWKPGQSGNPLGGLILKQRNEAQRARLAELRKALLDEFPNPTVLERALIDQAGDALELAERGGDNNRVRLVRLALQLMKQIRDGRAERRANKPVLNAFDAYLADKAGAR